MEPDPKFGLPPAVGPKPNAWPSSASVAEELADADADVPQRSTGDVLVIELAPYRGWKVYVLKSDDNGEYFFRVDAGNGEPIYRTTETHPDAARAERMAKLAAPYAQLVPYRESD